MLLTEKKRMLYSELFKDANMQLHDAFSQVKDEFEDHLVAINENTNEIQSNYELLCDIDQKLNKFAERLDRIEIFLHKQGLEAEEKQEFRPVRLSKREQEIFLILYTLEEVKGSVTYLDIAKKVFSPPVNEVLWAKKVISLMGDGSGCVMIEGKMQDDATVKQCHVMVGLAKLLAKRDPDLKAAYQFTDTDLS